MRATLVSSTIFCGILAIGMRPLQAIPEYTEIEKKECAFCHPSGDLFALNDAGQYYAEHRTLKGYGDEKPEPPKPEPAKPKPEPVKPKSEPAKK